MIEQNALRVPENYRNSYRVSFFWFLHGPGSPVLKVRGFLYICQNILFMVRAKFICDSVIENVVGGSTVSLHAVYGFEGENSSFTKHTPAGNLQLVIEDNTPAVKFFKQGQPYYLDISEAPSE